ncbi:alpha/beta fold hydrolase [soil metagenome]
MAHMPAAIRVRRAQAQPAGKSSAGVLPRVKRGQSPRFAAHPTPLLVFAHGAGAGSANPWMASYADALAARGHHVVTFDFPYVRAGRSIPDKPPVLEAAFREAIAAARKKFPTAPIFLGGKSMGGRMASHLAAQGEPCTGLFFFGYPLHPPAKPEKRRDEHLPKVTAPMLFVQGERDLFGTKREMTPLVKRLGAKLVVVAEGDHSFDVPKRSGKDEAAVRAFACDAVADFVSSLCRS